VNFGLLQRDSWRSAPGALLLAPPRHPPCSSAERGAALLAGEALCVMSERFRKASLNATFIPERCPPPPCGWNGRRIPGCMGCEAASVSPQGPTAVGTGLPFRRLQECRPLWRRIRLAYTYTYTSPITVCLFRCSPC